MDKNIWRCAPVAVGLLAAMLPAHAGRPLSVEDAGVNDLAQCQVESWFSRTSGSGTRLVVAPACGVLPGVELGLEVGCAEAHQHHRCRAWAGAQMGA